MDNETEKLPIEYNMTAEKLENPETLAKLIVSVLGAISAYEREINSERREFGYRKACEDGRVGRPKATGTDDFYKAVAEWREGKITATEAIIKAGMTRTTFYKLVKVENL